MDPGETGMPWLVPQTLVSGTMYKALMELKVDKAMFHPAFCLDE